MQKLFSFFIALFIGLSSMAQLTDDQVQQIDSLKEVISTAKHDTVKINALFSWDNIIYASDPELDLELNQQIIDVCETNLKNELNVSELNKFKKLLTNSLNNIGLIYSNQGNYEKALDYYAKSIKIREEIGDKSGTGGSYNNIGIIYDQQGNLEKALENYSESLKISEEIGDKKGVSSSLTNIANIYYVQGNYEKSLEYILKCLEIDKELGDKRGMANSYHNIGAIYKNQGNMEKALEYYAKSLKISEEIGDKMGMGHSYNNIGIIYDEQGNLKKALEYLLLAKNLFQEIYVISNLDETLKALSDVYKKLGKYKQALEMHELYMETKDSIAKIDAEEELYKFEVDKEYQLKKQADSITHADEILIQQAENLAKEEQLKSEKQRRTGLIIIVGLVLLSLIFVFIQLRKTRSQKVVIESQHEELEKNHLVLEEAHKDITDSIVYAKRIQDATLTSNTYIKDVLPQSFIYFNPKEIVSGDFYWVFSDKENVFFTVADCTGHGVPGAFMSMIGNSFLNEMIIENKIKDTNLIMDGVSNKVKLSLDQKGRKGESRDGMDMVLCRLNMKTNELMYTGAKNSLLLIRDGEVIEYKGDKRPVGYYLGQNILFTAHKLTLQQKDTLYLFSDGYSDQFGGEKNKKYKSANFKRFLLSIKDKDMDTQRELMGKEFERWKGDIEQIDDVCVMGVRV